MVSVVDGAMIAEFDHFKSFAAERFRSQVEAASFLGGPAGLEALLGFEEFARALRISGYRRPAERLFQQLARDGMVSVGELLKDITLAEVAATRAEDDIIAAETIIAADLAKPSSLARATVQERLTANERATLAPLEVAGAIRAENRLREEVEGLANEVRQIKRVVNDAASRDSLVEERSGREQTEGELRQHCVKLEESLARETVALRADNADLRSSLTEVLRVTAEERKERQNDVQDVSRRVKDVHHFADEKTQRVEGLVKAVQGQANDNRTALQEIEQLREMSEFRCLGAVSEEARNRDAAIQREQQAREVICAELETRWKTLLNEERTLRTRENDQLTLQLSKCEDMLRTEREAMQAMKSDFAAQIEDLMRKLHDEARLRQSEFTQLVVQAEEARTALQNEVRERRDNEEVLQKKILVVDAKVDQNLENSEQEFSLLKQTVLDLREAGQIEATAREEAVNKLRNLLDDESRAREEAVSTEVSHREAGENRIENHWRILMSEERTTREEAETQLEATIMSLQHEFNFEKSKVAAQARELAQSMTQVREGLTSETAARRHEIGQLTKGLEDMCSSLVDEQAARESSEAKLRESVGEVAITLRGETVVREEAERRANTERVELQSALQREAGTREECEARLMQRIADERRLREEAIESESKLREESDSKLAAQTQKSINDERKTREQGQRSVEHRCLMNEEGLGVYKNEVAEHDRETSARFAELEDGLNEARRLARETLLRREELVAVKDLLLSEKAERQAEDSALELAVKEQGVRMEQLQQSQELAEKRIDKRCLDLAERVDNESKERIAGDAEGDRNLADERTDRVNSQLAERRAIQEMVSKVEEAFGKAVLEERHGREEGDSVLDAKCLQLREAIDEARRWQVQATKEALQKEAGERRADHEKLAASQTEAEERFAKAEQARIRSEGQLHQENLELKATVKREARDRELADAKLSTLVREETQARTEAIQREGRLRQEAVERSSEAMHQAIREERKARERDDLRLENRSLANVGGKAALDSSMVTMEFNESTLAAEQRAITRRVSEIEDRIQQNEVRQKSAEERTVGMLDAIMTGLQSASD
eukprot:gnl/MRDRNA2_/MRDRNA2_115360_c0_seq1.p1 gnl/MRDRNA2_/MRDRNA2_115360_c0~~gnl/MRDRNA2_/MRDRNA2_115360_c0_seq1.p1  ORF type:complete len:1084 (-),score=338.06 gnl/MRDRNA2_/MRDRNA2_115360_c0_seq1:73-3324(-)